MHANQPKAAHKAQPLHQPPLTYPSSNPNLPNYNQHRSAPLQNFQSSPPLPMQYSQPAQPGHLPVAAGIPITSHNTAVSHHAGTHASSYPATVSQSVWPITSQLPIQASLPQAAALPAFSGAQQPLYPQQPQQQLQKQSGLPVLPGYPQQAAALGQVTGSVTARTPSPVPLQASASPVASTTGRGFTANQLNVLRNQILAFRRIKASTRLCISLIIKTPSCYGCTVFWQCLMIVMHAALISHQCGSIRRLVSTSVKGVVSAARRQDSAC